MFLLGVLAQREGKLDEAAVWMERATKMAPERPAFHSDLGETYRRLGRLSEAVDALIRAAELRPDLGEPIFNLGLLMRDVGDRESAMVFLERATQLKPDVAAFELALDEARRETSRHLLSSDSPESGRPVDSRLPVDAWLRLARFGRPRGLGDVVMGFCRRALSADPSSVLARVMLADLLQESNRLDEAATLLEQASLLEPSDFALLVRLVEVLIPSGRIEEAVGVLRRCLAMREVPAVRSLLLQTLNYHPSCADQEIDLEARRWDATHGEGARASEPFANDPSPDRRLRIGYVSAHFTNHSHRFFLNPLFSNHDHEGFEIFCYANIDRPDDETARLRSLVDHWRETLALDDNAMAELIRRDRIDLLVDLDMHAANNRLLVFARKPAPIQMCWLAYPGTTGLSAMDYRISDPHLDPEPADHAERTLCLPDTFWCYDPLENGPAVGPLPSDSAGFIRFGSLNDYVKISSGTLDVWSEVLRSVPTAKLTLLLPPGDVRLRMLDQFMRRGIEPSRVEALDRHPRVQYLSSYQRMDICLDPFPYSGHTTSLDALWMGVPVVTFRVPNRVVGRGGACFLSNLALNELIANTSGEYVRIATELAADRPRLRELRASLRSRIEASPLMDGRRFARNLEDGYRRAWVEWCSRNTGASTVNGSVTDLYHLALEHHRAGRLDDAERTYREVTARQPDHGDAKYLLSVLAMQSGRLQMAAELLESATTLEPEKPAFRVNLGEAYRRLGRREQAVTAFVHALAQKPDLAEAHFNLALALDEGGELVAAVDCFERALQLKPDHAQFQKRLSETRGRRDSMPSASLRRSKNESLSFFAAQAFLESGLLDEATTWYERAVDVTPWSEAAHIGLGVAHEKKGLLDPAIANFRRAIDLDPALGLAQTNLAVALGNAGLVEEAITCNRRGVALSPEMPHWHSNLIFDLPFALGSDESTILTEARAWNERHAKTLAKDASFASHDRSAERPLRIGYVSPHFYNHCQSFFTIPLLAHHDRDQFRIYCYSSVAKPDDNTKWIADHADEWRQVSDVDDAGLARMIREDCIDILVDLTMHMANHRLLAFARKPAPVQICWLAYPGTTGLSAMDYRVTDRFLDPPEVELWPYREQPLRLPETFWCYDPLTSIPEVSALPASKTGSVTFGCLNNFKKVNEVTIAMWADVLRAVPESRMVLLAPMGSTRTRVRQAFERSGVGADRIEFVDRQSRLDYLGTFCEIDICLDTLPYNGHTTSLDAFWMGVPVVTLVGSTVVGRAGLCLAQNLDLPQLVAGTRERFVEIAVALAKDLPALAEYRTGMRARMERSPLMDAPRFARHLEAAYRQAWRRWCAMPP
jgi:predicted O-linked N-acetylglucosamine transferase (SPINDLY family)